MTHRGTRESDVPEFVVTVKFRPNESIQVHGPDDPLMLADILIRALLQVNQAAGEARMKERQNAVQIAPAGLMNRLPHLPKDNGQKGS